jgi:hypothetical protein
LEGFKSIFENKVFNEFVIETSKKNIKKIQNVLLKNNFLAPLDLSGINENFKNCLLFRVTDQKTKTEIDRLTKDFSESVEIDKNIKMNIKIFEDPVTSYEQIRSGFIFIIKPKSTPVIESSKSFKILL